jgi:hypothetical protein
MSLPRVLAPLFLAAAACSSTSSSPDSAPTTDLPALADTAKTGCGDISSLIVSEDRGCNTLPLPSTRVPFTTGTGSSPTFTGGTLVDGLYTAVKAEGWTGTAGTGRQMGIVIGNGGKTLLWFGLVLNADGTGDPDAGAGVSWLRSNYDLSVASSNTLGLSPTCETGPAKGPAELMYTAVAGNPPQLLLANASSPTAAVTTYAWQGCAP